MARASAIRTEQVQAQVLLQHGQVQLKRMMQWHKRRRGIAHKTTDE